MFYSFGYNRLLELKMSHGAMLEFMESILDIEDDTRKRLLGYVKEAMKGRDKEGEDNFKYFESLDKGGQLIWDEMIDFHNHREVTEFIDYGYKQKVLYEDKDGAPLYGSVIGFEYASDFDGAVRFCFHLDLHGHHRPEQDVDYAMVPSNRVFRDKDEWKKVKLEAKGKELDKMEKKGKAVV